MSKFQNGNIPWNKDKKGCFTTETKMKMSSRAKERLKDKIKHPNYGNIYWTIDKRQELWNFWKKGLPIRLLAEKYGCSESAIAHQIRLLKQQLNLDIVHHPREKEKQIREILKGQMDLMILECFSGRGNLTKVYKTYGKVITIDKLETKKRNHYVGDSFKIVHKLISDGNYFDVIDIDSYGYPSRHFPHIFQLLKDGYLFVTFPYKTAIKNKITKHHLLLFWGVDKPKPDDIIKRIQEWGKMYYRDVKLIDWKKFDNIFRFAFKVDKISSWDMVGLEVKPKNLNISKTMEE